MNEETERITAREEVEDHVLFAMASPLSLMTTLATTANTKAAAAMEGQNVNAVDAWGCTPLFYAALHGNYPLCQQLRGSGAVNQLPNGRRCSDVALTLEIRKMLAPKYKAPRVAAAAAHYSNYYQPAAATTGYAGLTAAQLRLLQTRDRFTADDYALLLQLDSTIPPKVVKDINAALHAAVAASADGASLCCSICQTDVEANEMVRTTTKCSHTFHACCIEQYFCTANNCCPNCKCEY